MSALHQWSNRHSEDGRDETRTGGGLSFSEEWSSPVDHAQPTERYGRHRRSRNPTSLLAVLHWLVIVSKTRELHTLRKNKECTDGRNVLLMTYLPPVCFWSRAKLPSFCALIESQSHFPLSELHLSHKCSLS